MSQFEKGNTRGRGRPKGAQSKTTTEARQLMHELLVFGLENGKDRVKNMSNYDYVAFMSLLARHTVAPPREVNEDGTTDTKLTITIKPDDLQ